MGNSLRTMIGAKYSPLPFGHRHGPTFVTFPVPQELGESLNYPNTNTYLFPGKDPERRDIYPTSKGKKGDPKEVVRRMDRNLKQAIREEFDRAGIGEFAEEFAAKVR